MSKENVKNFFEELGKNPAMNGKFIEAVKKKKAQTTIISFAESNGFTFSDTELQEFCLELADKHRANGELSDADLVNAAGGGLASESGRWIGELFQRIIHGKNIFERWG